MPEPITRRQFLQGSALLAGAAVIFDPRSLFGGQLLDHQRGHDPQGLVRRNGEGGLSTQVEYGDGDSAPLVRWTRLGRDHTLELWTDRVVLDVPTISGTELSIALGDFEWGQGQQDVIKFFGPATFDHLRTEVTHRSVLVGQFERA